MRKHILVVDSNIEDLIIINNTLKKLYEVTLLDVEEKLLEVLQYNKIDLILIDLNISKGNNYETIKKIKEDKNINSIPIIFLSGEMDNKNEVKGMELGAVDFIRKPLVAKILLNRIRVHLEVKSYREELEEKVEEKTRMIENLQDVIILSLAELVECRDIHTGGHVKRTAKYVEILTKGILERKVYNDILTPLYVHNMIRSAPLHDVGKIGINDATLLKAGSLDEDEFEFMKQHTSVGAKALQKIIDETNGENFLYIAKDMAHYHHEKWDGTGYPQGLKGEEIPLCARIMAIGDVYDALTTSRPYKKPFTHEKAVKLILLGKGTNFDPKLIEVFEEISYKFELEKEKI
ncbi:HD domain-containing phosphohydrolase [Clostridioides difficile]